MQRTSSERSHQVSAHAARARLLAGGHCRRWRQGRWERSHAGRDPRQPALDLLREDPGPDQRGRDPGLGGGQSVRLPQPGSDPEQRRHPELCRRARGNPRGHAGPGVHRWIPLGRERGHGRCRTAQQRTCGPHDLRGRSLGRAHPLRSTRAPAPEHRKRRHGRLRDRVCDRSVGERWRFQHRADQCVPGQDDQRVPAEPPH